MKPPRRIKTILVEMDRFTELELEALDEFLNAMSKDERDFFRRVVRKVRRVRVRRVIRKVGRSVRRVARHIKKGINWIGDKLKILEIAKALKKLISKGLNFAGFNFRQDARELAGILRERNQKKLEDKLVKFVAKVRNFRLTHKGGQSFPFSAEFRFPFSVLRGKFAERKIDQKSSIKNLLFRTLAKRCLKKYQRLVNF